MTVTDQLLGVFESLFGLWLSLALATLGTVTNMICLIVFSRCGFKESANISLAAIAVTDFLKCLFGFIHRLYGILNLFDMYMATFWENLTYIPNIHVQTVGRTMANVYTAYVTLERGLCVVLPFKVRLIITPKVTYTALSVLTGIVLISYFHVVCVYEVFLVFDENLNQTMAMYRPTRLFKDSPLLLDYLNIIGICWPVVTFTIVVICTAIIIVRMRHLSHFRYEHRQPMKQILNGETKPGLNRKDSQMLKMLLVIVALYMFNVLPRILMSIARLAEPEYYINRRYNNLYWIMANVIFAIDYINSSANFFVYHFMSSNFRENFYQLFLVTKNMATRP